MSAPALPARSGRKSWKDEDEVSALPPEGSIHTRAGTAVQAVVWPHSFASWFTCWHGFVDAGYILTFFGLQTDPLVLAEIFPALLVGCRVPLMPSSSVCADLPALLQVPSVSPAPGLTVSLLPGVPAPVGCRWRAGLASQVNDRAVVLEHRSLRRSRQAGELGEARLPTQLEPSGGRGSTVPGQLRGQLRGAGAQPASVAGEGFSLPGLACCRLAESPGRGSLGRPCPWRTDRKSHWEEGAASCAAAT